jgi:N-carbamoyl-L-amino-acid hydrolase
VATVGAVEVEPNATNVVPGRVTVAVDARAPSAEQLAQLVAAIGFEPTWMLEPVAMSGAPFEALSAVLPDAPRLVSGAGHDAMVLAAAGVPTGSSTAEPQRRRRVDPPDELTRRRTSAAVAVDAAAPAALERLSAGVSAR